MRITSLLKILAVSASAALAPSLASAQAYPSRAIKIIVPAPPGGAIDIIARVVGEKLQASTGQPVIIDNKPGASNNLGTDALAKSAPDGYTIGIVGGSHNINKFLFKNLGWDPETSFEPIVYTHEVPLVFAIYPQIPGQDAARIRGLAEGPSRPGQGRHFRPRQRPGNGGRDVPHGEWRGDAADPLQGLFRRPAGPDRRAHGALHRHDQRHQSQVKAGTVRAIAVSTRKRTAALPDVPTADEQGLKGYDANTNGGFLAPAGTPKAIITKLNAEINAALKMPDVRTKLETAGIEVQGGTPQEYAALIKSDLAKWSKVIKAAGIPAE
jgi:tripartite-type tricarboxylate transporter receptor subunit TctC